MEEDPFPGLVIDDFSFLNNITQRSSCHLCKKSRKYYCYTCCVPLLEIAEHLPKVKLPIKLDIIKHPNEVDGKSTGIHAALLSSDVTLYNYPCIPDWTDRSKVLLVFPGKSSVTVDELSRRHRQECISNTTNKLDNYKPLNKRTLDDTCMLDASKKLKLTENSDKNVSQKNDQFPFERVVFIESTWSQTKKIYLDERLQGLQCIELKEYKTKFWRHQRDKPDTYLATIEAIYYFYRELHDSFIGSAYAGEYDNLLFFYLYMYHKIRQECAGGKELTAYKLTTENKSKKREKVASCCNYKT